jgi:hypothetical protein
MTCAAGDPWIHNFTISQFHRYLFEMGNRCSRAMETFIEALSLHCAPKAGNYLQSVGKYLGFGFRDLGEAQSLKD